MGNGLAARNGGWVGLAALIAILLLGVGLRVGEAWDGRAPVYDEAAYAAHAESEHFRRHGKEDGIPRLTSREREFLVDI